MRKPIAIYDKHFIRLFSVAPTIIKDAWDQYAYAEAVNIELLSPDKGTDTLNAWTPPLSFTEFCAKHSPYDPHHLEKTPMPTITDNLLSLLLQGSTLYSNVGTLKLDKTNLVHTDMTNTPHNYKDKYMLELIIKNIWSDLPSDGLYEVKMYSHSRETTYLSLIKGVWYDVRYKDTPVDKPHNIVQKFERNKL